MAHFYVSTENSRGNPVTASGTTAGQHVHIRGWESGVKVFAHVNVKGEDEFTIYRTSGSNSSELDQLLGTVVGDVFYPSESGR